MKKLLKKSLIWVIPVLLLMISDGSAVGTTSGTLITNRATVLGDNFTSTSNGVGTNVQPIIGGNWPASLDINGASGTEIRSNVSFLTNLGNALFNFRIAVDSANSNVAGGCGGPWPFVLMTNGVTYYIGSNNHVAGGNIPIASAASKRITFKVTIAAGASTGWREWRLVATTPDSHRNTVAYTGDDTTTIYGGPLATGWGMLGVADSLVWWGTAGGNDNIFRITCAAPTITIMKSIYSIAVADGGAPDNVAIPGATIRYRIVITNSGTGGATGVKVRDYVDTVNLIYVGGSMTATNTTGGPYTWNTNVAAGVLQWSNATGPFTGGSRTVFTFRAIIM